MAEREAALLKQRRAIEAMHDLLMDSGGVTWHISLLIVDFAHGKDDGCDRYVASYDAWPVVVHGLKIESPACMRCAGAKCCHCDTFVIRDGCGMWSHNSFAQRETIDAERGCSAGGALKCDFLKTCYVFISAIAFPCWRYGIAICLDLSLFKECLS